MNTLVDLIIYYSKVDSLESLLRDESLRVCWDFWGEKHYRSISCQQKSANSSHWSGSTATVHEKVMRVQERTIFLLTRVKVFNCVLQLSPGSNLGHAWRNEYFLESRDRRDQIFRDETETFFPPRLWLWQAYIREWNLEWDFVNSIYEIETETETLDSWKSLDYFETFTK